jgi:chromosome segregation ATPase
MNATNAVLKGQLEKALADVKDSHKQSVDRQAENSALRSHLEKEIEDMSVKLDEQVKKCLEQEALKAQVSALEKQLKEMHQEGKAQIEQLEARAAVLDRELEGAALENSKRSVRHISILHTQLEKALADVKDSQQQIVERQAENSALRSQLEMEIENTWDKCKQQDELRKKCQEQDDRIQQLGEELASTHKLLADNKMKDDEVIASGKAEIVSLKAKVLALEKKLSEGYKAHEKELADRYLNQAIDYVNELQLY